MLYFDIINPYIIYITILFAFAFSVFAIFVYRQFITKHKQKIMTIALILVIWTQIARYIGVFFSEDVIWSFWIFNFKIVAFDLATHLPFYICRLSVVVLLYYLITKDKRVESFLFYWGATGLAGILYPNGEISNIANLTETFYIDHFLLGLTPYFLIVYQGYKPIKRDLFIITGVMFAILLAFLPLNYLLNLVPNLSEPADYFYVNRHSILEVIWPGIPNIMFIIIHTLAAFGFFSAYYFLFKNKKYNIKK